jgi:hypothetical protein
MQLRVYIDIYIIKVLGGNYTIKVLGGNYAIKVLNW